MRQLLTLLLFMFVADAVKQSTERSNAARYRAFWNRRRLQCHKTARVSNGNYLPKSAAYKHLRLGDQDMDTKYRTCANIVEFGDDGSYSILAYGTDVNIRRTRAPMKMLGFQLIRSAKLPKNLRIDSVKRTFFIKRTGRSVIMHTYCAHRSFCNIDFGNMTNTIRATRLLLAIDEDMERPAPKESHHHQPKQSEYTVTEEAPYNTTAVNNNTQGLLSSSSFFRILVTAYNILF